MIPFPDFCYRVFDFSSLLRVTQSATLDSTTGSNTQALFLGKQGKEFEFKDLKSKVEFCECSAKTSEELKPLEEWLMKIA